MSLSEASEHNKHYKEAKIGRIYFKTGYIKLNK